jgi:hypothetical protein
LQPYDRSPHQALDALTVGIERKRVLDADSCGFFDNLSHEWTMKSKSPHETRLRDELGRVRERLRS